MANSITKQKFNSIRRYVYVVGLLVIIIWVLLYGLSLVWNIWIDNLVTERQSQLALVEKKVTELGSEKSFFSYNFATKITKENGIKRSEHIRSLIDVLNQIQSNSSVGANAVVLSDFTITPQTISLKGKVKDLLLLYYSSKERNYTSVIDRFTGLPFISNVSIKKYTKVWDYYEFVLNADINLNVALQTNTTDTSRGTNANTGANTNSTGSANTGSVQQ